MKPERKYKLLKLLDEYCNEYYSDEHECNDCYFSRYNNCPLSKTANRLQEEIFEETPKSLHNPFFDY